MKAQLVRLALFALILHLSSAASDLKILTKEQWNGRPAQGVIAALQQPVPKVIIAHTATNSCFNEETCTSTMRYIQIFHMDARNFADIAYNFLVGGDGVIYEGRGWHKQGAHTLGHNRDSICIALIGTFENKEPSKEQLSATKLLLEKGVLEKKFTPNYKLFGHRQLATTNSPGSKLYEIIKTWPHWAEF